MSEWSAAVTWKRIYSDTYQVEVALKRAELLGAKVFGEHRSAELSYIKDAERFARFGPADDHGVIHTLLQKFRFTIQHLVKPTGELLRHTSLPRARESKLSKRTRLGCSCHC